MSSEIRVLELFAAMTDRMELGMPPAQAAALLQENASWGDRRILRHVQQRLLAGDRTAAAFAAHVSVGTAGVLEGFEKAGQLMEGVRQTIDVKRQSSSTMMEFATQVVYGVFVLVCTLAVYATVIAGDYADGVRNLTLPAVTQALIITADGIRVWWPLVVGLVSSVFLGGWGMLLVPSRHVQAFAQRIPFLSAVQGHLCANLLDVWALRFASGVSWARVMEESGGSASMRVQQLAVRARLMDGELVATALSASPGCDRIAQWELRTLGHAADDLPALMRRVARDLRRRSFRRIERMAGPVKWACLGLAMGLMCWMWIGMTAATSVLGPVS